MLQHSLSRTELLVGKDGLNKLKDSKVIVFGVGGVGSFTVEALVRAGVGTIILVDDDTICLTNLNRQIHATYDTVGKVKVEAMKERVLSINKRCNVITHQIFVTKENIPEIITDDIDYVVDAIDTVSAKIALVEYCNEKGIKIMCSMGTGNKFDPTKPKLDDVVTCKTGCVCTGGTKKCAIKRQIPGSISFVPPVAGMIIGGEVIKDLLKED